MVSRPIGDGAGTVVQASTTPPLWRPEPTISTEVRSARRGPRNRAGHTGGVHRAVAVGHLVQVLLVVVLGVIERAGGGDLGRDRVVPRIGEALAEGVPGPFGGAMLLLVGVVDRR